MDLIKHFSEFIDLEGNKERFKVINEYFFEEDDVAQEEKRNRQAER